jgi:hypothetical protein
MKFSGACAAIRGHRSVARLVQDRTNDGNPGEVVASPATTFQSRLVASTGSAVGQTSRSNGPNMKPYLLMLLIGAISALSDLLGRGRQSAAVVVEAGARRGRRSDQQDAR